MLQHIRLMPMNDFKLNDEPKIASGFTTPESYFDDFPRKLTLRLQSEVPKVVSLQTKRKTWIYAAAAILIIAISITFSTKIYTTNRLDTITTENYLVSQVGIADELLYLLDEDDFQSMMIDMKIEDQAIEDMLSTNPDFEQYLIN